MARISGSNTKPEIVVRKILYGLGFRYRLNVRKLPGTPDIVLSKHNKVVFVHGCFWHGHKGCKRSERPTTNVAFWNRKIDKNIDRDKKSLKELRRLGWKPLVIWECQTKKPESLGKRLIRFFK
ncbi:MAG: very short patch repair endonuclease [Deltaproteobacteria bacterium]|nr:very short patch repair endonuclease [Deltaproteobacteria bacterium]